MPLLLSFSYLSWIYYALMVVYGITVISIVGVIVSENRSPVKSLAWVTVLLLLPALGIVLYLVFGRSIKNTRMISRRNRRKLKRSEGLKRKVFPPHPSLSQESKQLIKLTSTLGGSPAYSSNTLEVYTCGKDKFDALIHDISQAGKSVNLQYYILEDDDIGNRLKRALIDSARRGVAVRIIYDNVGSYRTGRKFFKELEDAGVQAYPFFKVVFPPFGTRINWRNHRKIAVIDGHIGYIGGMNVADRYIHGGKFATWRDTHIRIQGPAALTLHYSFAVDWNFMGQPLIEEPAPHTYPQRPGSKECTMQLLTSGPTSQWTTIAYLFNRAISSAKKRVYIHTPYFLPTEALNKALQAAALSGVDVRIMVPAHSDSTMLTYATSSYIEESLRAGIKFYLYEAGMLHSKMMIVDDEFVSIGSTNFDFRSFEHNFEANIQIYSKEECEKMTKIFYEDLKNSCRVHISEWKRRPWPKKVLESVTRLLSPIL